MEEHLAFKRPENITAEQAATVGVAALVRLLMAQVDLGTP